MCKNPLMAKGWKITLKSKLFFKNSIFIQVYLNNIHFFVFFPVLRDFLILGYLGPVNQEILYILYLNVHHERY